MATKSVVLHSGGMDSSVCLLLAKAQGREVVSLGINYNQNCKIELEYARQICARFGVTRKELNIEWDKPERFIPKDRSPKEMSQTISPAFLPGRNAVFLVLGCTEAAGLGATEVWIGVNSIDYSGYPDCRKEFIDTFQTMINIAIPTDIKIVAPLINMSKPQIADLAREFGLKENDTWSCYTPIQDNGIQQPCGHCDACILHSLAWHQAK